MNFLHFAFALRNAFAFLCSLFFSISLLMLIWFSLFFKAIVNISLPLRDFRSTTARPPTATKHIHVCVCV